MSLSGNLGFVSLDEVLRLLNRSKQRGAVEVQGGKTKGRIFVDRGSVSLATLFTNEQLRDHLAKSGLVDGGDSGAITALLREMTVETIHQLGLLGESFAVVEDQTSPYHNDTPFELEELLADVRQRLTDWTDVSQVVTDLEAMIRMRRDLGERDRVTVEKESWRLLSEVGHGASVRRLAEELGTTEFWAARVAAGMIEDDLLTLEAGTAAEVIEEPAPVWEEAAPAMAEPTTREEESPTREVETAAGAEPSTWEEVAGPSPLVADPVYAEARGDDQQEGVFQEPEAESSAHAAVDDTESEAERAEVDPDQSWWSEPEREAAAMEAEAGAAATEEIEEDTEAFLEKVFSELEPTDTADEGYGLLRRRRMGALRDFSNDS